MTRLLRCVGFCALVLSAGTYAGAQESPAPTAGVLIGGIAPHPLTISSADFALLPHEHVDVVDDDKSTATYDGVELHVLLERAGVQLGEAMHGPRLLDYVVVTAADGYHAIFSLAELDPAFIQRKIILADRRNGTSLDAKHGPLRVVVADEARHARWVREVTTIVVAHASEP